jgi:putative aldouronate transport system substrate-binding protein
MNTSRKFVVTLLTLIMVFTMAACSNSKQEASTPAPAKEAEAATPAPTLNADEPGWKAAAANPITFDWYMNFSWFNKKWADDATSTYVTKKTGVKVNFIVPAGNENEKLNTMIASGKLPDFITLGWYEEAVKKMVAGKLVLPLNELADQYDPYFYKVADPAKLGWYKNDDGNVYGYPNASSSPEDYK